MLYIWLLKYHFSIDLVNPDGPSPVYLITLDESGGSNCKTVALNVNPTDEVIDIDQIESYEATEPLTKTAEPQKTTPKNVTPKNMEAKKVPPKKSIRNATDTSGTKPKKTPFSFRRTKTTKEIVLEQKQLFEKEKMEKKSKDRMEHIRFIEEQKQRRHEERCKVLKDIFGQK